MHGLSSATAGLVLAMLASSTAAAFLRRQNDGNPSASQYTDAKTNITFLGYAPATTGFTFGFALPTSPTSDLIVQLVSPLNDAGGGYGAIDFGASMTGFLMVAAWPDPGTKAVKVSPRIATGYEIANGANLYTAANLTITPIAAGTFTNATHVAATFVCGGCVAAPDSFQRAVAAGKTTFSYAYSLTAVADPGDVDSALSDHTAKGELYGPFDVALAGAESSQYETWAAMTATPTGAAGAGAAGAAATAAASAASGSGSGGGGASSSGSPGSSSSETVQDEHSAALSAPAIAGYLGVGCVYVLHALQIL